MGFLPVGEDMDVLIPRRKVTAKPQILSLWIYNSSLHTINSKYAKVEPADPTEGSASTGKFPAFTHHLSYVDGATHMGERFAPWWHL